jgi:transcriptional regulator with XRE-family HTH domain
MTIGARLKLIRTKSKMSLEKLGEIFDLTSQTLSRYENGKRTPDNDFLEAFGKHFKISGDWLLYGEPPIYRASGIERDVKESFIELTQMINERDFDIPERSENDLEKVSENSPENFILLLKYMLKYPEVCKNILQFFFLFQKPAADKKA